MAQITSQITAQQVRQSTAAMLGVDGQTKNANEQMALALEQTLKSIVGFPIDLYNKLSAVEQEKLIDNFVAELTPAEIEAIKQQTKIRYEKNQVAMGARPKVDSLHDYLETNDYGKELLNYLKVKEVDKNGNPILYEATGYGYDKYIAGKDKITLDSNKDSLIVYDSAGNLKAVLNLDGTKNDYLTNSYKEIGTVLLPPLINPIPEPKKPIIIGTPIPERNKDEGKFVTPILDDKYPINTAHDGSGTPEIKHDTGGNQIIEKDWRDNVLTADNRLPIPEKTTANNGLDIESNTKHTPGAPGFRPNAGIEPKDSLDLFEKSVPTEDPKVRLAIDDEGNIHRFSNSSKDGSGTYHWSGSAGDKNPLGHNELRKFNDIIKELKAK